MKRYLILFFILSLLFTTSCNDSNSGTSDNGISVRAILESEESSTVDIKVYVEGADGNALTGAVVLVSDSQNKVTNLEFDSDKYCYTGSAPVLSDGMFIFKVNSLAVADMEEFTVPHTILSIKPVVSTFQDADGNSVLSGQALSSSKEIQVAWNSVGSDIVYQVTVKTALRTLYSVSTNACNISIPASSITAGTNYMFEIIAQKIYGDPYFQNANYYSVSIIRSAMVSFDVQ